jgi:putative transposase
MGEPPELRSPAQTCSQCGSARVIRFGRRLNRTGPASRYLCKDCGTRFTDRRGALRLRQDANTVALALDLYFRGLSLRKVSDHLRQAYGLAVAPATIYGWVARIGPRAARWMDSLGARTGERWHADETVVKVDGDHRWVWNVIDAETRFLLATRITRLRRLRDARLVMRRATAATPDRPLAVLTDGLPAYRKAIGRELAFRSGAEVVNPHVRVPSIRAKTSNNLVERLHSTQKERLKVMRGLHGKNGPKAIIEGFRVHYNLVRSHRALAATPGIAAGLPDLGQFRWKEIIRRSSERVPPGQVDVEFVVR